MPPLHLDARSHLSQLVGQTIETYTGRPNKILEIRGTDVIVGTGKSPHGTPVPIEWIQAGIDRLLEEGEVEESVASLGYRSAFVGAVLLSVPGTQRGANPTRVTFVP